MNAVKMCGLVAVATLVGSGCGSDNVGGGAGEAGSGGSAVAGTSAAGASGSVSGAGAGGKGGSGGESEEPPLLERPAELAYDCEVTRPMALLGLDPWSLGGLHAIDGGATLTRLQGGMSATPFGMDVTWSSLGFDGTLGAAHALPVDAQTYVTQLESTQVEDELALLWTESSSAGAQPSLTRVQPAGDVTKPTVTLSTGAQQTTAPVFTAVSDGYAVGWTESSDVSGLSTILLARVGADGTRQGDVHTVVEGAGYLQAQGLVAHAGGLTLFYSHSDYVSNTLGTYYRRFDAGASPLGEPVKLGDGLGPVSAIARGDQLLVAWTEQTGSFDENLARTIHVGAIGESGARVGPKLALQSPVLDEDNVDPHWVDLGEDVGLFWAQGSIIYVCAGCFPDHALKFVVLSGEDFTPKSRVLSLPSPTEFGLLSPRAVRQADEILAVASATHHVSAEGASATIRCTP